MRFNRRKIIQKSWQRNSYVPVKVRKEVLKRDNFTCVFCELESVRTLCHLIPYCRGGDDSLENLVCCCRGCRQRKLCQLPLEFIFDGFWEGCEFEDVEEMPAEEKVEIIKSILNLLKDLAGLQKDVKKYFKEGQGENFMRGIEKILEVKK